MVSLYHVVLSQVTLRACDLPFVFQFMPTVFADRVEQNIFFKLDKLKSLLKFNTNNAQDITRSAFI